MPLDPRIQLGGQIALSLASLYLPGSGPAISGLAAVFAAVKAYNEANGKDPEYVPTREEWDSFIADRESKRIPEPPTPPPPTATVPSRVH